MHRLLKVHGVLERSVYNLSMPTNVQQSAAMCLFCRLCHQRIITKLIGHLQLRQQTTTSKAMLNAPTKKKAKRKTKKHAELLEVAGDATGNKVARVQNLKASHLSMLAHQPEITLDQLHKIKTVGAKKTKQCQKDTEDMINKVDDSRLLTHGNVGTFEGSIKLENIDVHADTDDGIATSMEDPDISGELDVSSYVRKELESESPEDSIVGESKLQSKKSRKKKSQFTVSLQKHQKDLLTKVSSDELVQKGKMESLVRNLHAYISVCGNCGMTNRALAALMRYRNSGKHSKKRQFVKNISLYNLLMHQFASEGNIEKVKDLLRILTEESICMVPQSYAAIFECIGRLGPSRDGQEEFLQSVKAKMTKQGITLNDVMDKSEFTYDQREYALEGIKLLCPSFKPTYSLSDLSYDLHLLHGISSTKGTVKSTADGLLTVSDLHDRMKQQISSEIIGELEVRSIEKHNDPTSIVSHYRKKIVELEDTWRKVASKAFERDFYFLENRESFSIPSSVTLYPYMNALKTDDYVNAIIREIRTLAKGSESFSPSPSWLSRELGRYVYYKYEIQTKQRNGTMDKTIEVYSKYCEWYMNRSDSNSRVVWLKLAHEARVHGASLDINDMQWPSNVLLEIGKFLYNIILNDIKVDVNCTKINSNQKCYLPAFYVSSSTQDSQMKQEINPHPELAKLYKGSQPEMLTFDATLLPSLCPPRPWSSVYKGGYLISKTEIIRVPYNAVLQWKRCTTAPPRQLYPVLDSLNQLSTIPWRINARVLDIAIEVFQNGGSVKLNVPRPPSVLPPLPLLDSNVTKEDRLSITKARAELRRQKAEMYSLWCEALYRLSIANHYRDKIFWLPHNMDFRGRVYPVPPHMSHLSSDLTRSILKFALGKPLGPDGLDWLKIHAINLTGLKKRESVDERLRYANEILDNILDSAEAPMTGNMWWASSDEPWQTLSTCIEISMALKCPNPADYVSGFPIHQDGSCNGLQHYAALGRDKIGALSVNLCPSAKPQDVYSNIAALVDEARERDEKNDVEVARVLKGFVQRKVIKQTVMTTVYGVTKFGARAQISKQLEDIEKFPENFVRPASLYLANKTFDTLRAMFKSAREIQDWLTNTARCISLVRGENVEWITPLGFPVVQPYNKKMKFAQGRTMNHRLVMDMFERPNTLKQKNAFAPNFIHSLDSSHMMLTSLYCEHAGLTFVSVHDCFWTHACTVDIMNKICRQQFVALHSEPILENLSKFMLERYGYQENELSDDKSSLNELKLLLNKVISQVPAKGSFDLKKVLSSVYFFS